MSSDGWEKKQFGRFSDILVRFVVDLEHHTLTPRGIL